jgi:hypothetical protein
VGALIAPYLYQAPSPEKPDTELQEFVFFAFQPVSGTFAYVSPLRPALDLCLDLKTVAALNTPPGMSGS